MHIATKRSNFLLAQKLLEHGADTTIKDNNGNEPIVSAQSLRDNNMVSLLNKNNGKTNIIEKEDPIRAATANHRFLSGLISYDKLPKNKPVNFSNEKKNSSQPRNNQNGGRKVK